MRKIIIKQKINKCTCIEKKIKMGKRQRKGENISQVYGKKEVYESEQN